MGLPSVRKAMEGVLVYEGLGEAPKALEFEGDTYFRFHDFLYVCGSLDQLDERQVAALCALRGQYSTAAQLEPNYQVRSVFKSFASDFRPEFLLEVGPGRRPLYGPEGEQFRYEVADLDQKIVSELAAAGYTASVFNRQNTLVQKAGSVDLIFAVFVLQFAFTDFQVGEIVRVLQSEGLIMANVYRRSHSSREELKSSFRSAGCEIEVACLEDDIGHDHEYWLIGPNLACQQCANAVEALKRKVILRSQRA